jgi:hypothetical protein
MTGKRVTGNGRGRLGNEGLFIIIISRGSASFYRMKIVSTAPSNNGRRMCRKGRSYEGGRLGREINEFLP